MCSGISRNLEPKVLVSDRDPRFTSIFWQRLMALTGTRLNMSTARHPQTDGQTERANRTLEEMLRAYVSPYQDDWDQHLLAVEFAYNNSEQASTKYSPFYLMYGEHPHVPMPFLSPGRSGNVVASGAEAAVTRMTDELQHAKRNLESAKQRQAEYANLWYKVKWVGYPEEENTWQEEAQLRQDYEELDRFVSVYRTARGLPEGFNTHPTHSEA